MLRDFWPLRPSPTARAEAQLRAYVQQGRFSGAVLVACGRRTLLSRGYGLASHEYGAANMPRTRFPIGSQTKAFTAIAVLQLAEQGRLRVGDALSAYLPGYPHGEQITLHHLLTNSSGIPDYITADGFSREMAMPHTLEQLIARFKDRALVFPPGERFGYSNSGWVLLGAVIERVAGVPYGEYVQHHICGPAGMLRSGQVVAGQVCAGLATGYTMLNERVSSVAPIDNSTQFAAGDLHATAEDLFSWGRALDRGTLLKPESYAAMHTVQIATDEGNYGYGCVVRTAFNRRCIETSGGTIGFVSITTRYPDDDVTIVVLANIENAPFSSIERDLAAIVFGEPYALPSKRSFVPVDPDLFGRYTGRYRMSYIGRTHMLDVTCEANRLMAEVQGLPKAELHALAPERYFAQLKGEVELTFLVGASGEAEAIALVWAGRPMTAQRVE